MDIRMLPIRHVFERFPRLVRDLARQQGKEIELILEGEGTRVDKAIIDEIGEPLVHMIRNSVDHGIEPPEVRVARGKTPTGTILLSAAQESNHVVITIMDDGAGIDAEQVRREGVQRGLLRGDEKLTDRERGAAHLLAGLLHRHPDHRPLRPRRGPGRGAQVHRAAERPGGGGDGARGGHQVHHPASPHPGHHLRPAGGGGRARLRRAPGLGGGEPALRQQRTAHHQRARHPAHPRPHRAPPAPGDVLRLRERRDERRPALRGDPGPGRQAAGPGGGPPAGPAGGRDQGARPAVAGAESARPGRRHHHGRRAGGADPRRGRALRGPAARVPPAAGVGAAGGLARSPCTRATTA